MAAAVAHLNPLVIFSNSRKSRYSSRVLLLPVLSTRIHARASRRFPNPPDAVVVVPGSRGSSWREIGRFDDAEEYETDGDDEEEEDGSLDLLVRFLHNVFRKVSRKARRAVRSVLHIGISNRLVRFSVDGSLILAFLWILKAFLEVACTFGTVVFMSVLLIRGIWSLVFFMQENRFNSNNSWNGVRPAT
ncbi:Short hypocotyl in white light1 protein [Zostera marina]|uniref:Short hypocotyl in white light1 protein n=1 Tax=Zostera marina TaxID=29655 RepID=A0A0K9P9Y6_ZOSMR|nr:Short hypocotyl in white light1 protein [Zostera marina]